jgi:hypothetical protein
MSTEDNIAIAAVRREFTDALAEVLAENAAGCPVRRGRVARAHAHMLMFGSNCHSAVGADNRPCTFWFRAQPQATGLSRMPITRTRRLTIVP